MTRDELTDKIEEILNTPDTNVCDVVEEVVGLADKYASEMDCMCPSEDDYRARFESDYEIPTTAQHDLDECIRTFEMDPKTAKYCLSRALKDIPGAPQWLD